jgi:seryl-tRNA synthetase
MNVAFEPASLPNTHEPAGPAALVQALFRGMGAPGVYARTGLYEDIVDRITALVSSLRAPEAEVLRFPPVMSRQDLERAGYLRSFPNLLGCVAVLDGGEGEIRQSLDRYEMGGDWTDSLTTADLVLSPAACYPVYPLAARRGTLPHGGLVFDVACDCFRREPSTHLDRMQSFRMREYVRIGSPSDVLAFRKSWMERAEMLAEELALPARIVPASDPFFGREGQMRGISQIQQALKFELLIPTWSGERHTACMSFNYHQDHFGAVWDIRDAAGGTAHTGCTAFGIDRLAVALFCNHGVATSQWPARVRQCLRL